MEATDLLPGKGGTRMIKRIEMSLDGGAAPQGEIAVKDLTSIAAAFQELVTRLARDTVHATGPGRSKQFVEEFAELRLSGITKGSTLLQFTKGPTDKLDVELPDLAETDDRLWALLDAIGADTRPTWSTDLIAESASKLVSALRGAARQVVVTSPSRNPVGISPQGLRLDTWAPRRQESGGAATAAGRLEKVDLKSHDFRLRDDVGDAVELRRVEDDRAAAKLVGEWVVAEGEASRNPAGRVVILSDVRVHQVDDPGAEFLGHRVVSIEEILSSAPGPDIEGGLDLTDEEFDAFLRAMRP